MRKILTTILFLAVVFIYAQENRESVQLLPKFHFGFEISELLQNDFRNLGPKNFTFFFGQEFWCKKLQNFGYRVLVINVDLSAEHLSNNNFIKGDKSGLTGSLTAGRIFFDWYPGRKKVMFIQFNPIFSTGLGYNRNIIQNNAVYDLNGITLDAGFRLQSVCFEKVFIEFPVIDGFLYLWKSRSAKGIVDNAIIDYPEQGMIFLWINFGIKISY
ncbi:MAG: hypothetical protein ABIL39_03315 [candidate division WOR-3 bacterium]